MSKYSNDQNPFGDSQLNQKFVWKKNKKEGGLKGSQVQDELLKLNQRRKEREKERELREREQQKNASGTSHLMDWKTKEDEFYLHQSKQRAEIRIKELRAKPIDLLSIYLTVDQNQKIADDLEALGFHLNFKDPVSLFKDLTKAEIIQLLEDMKEFYSLENNLKEKQFWDCLIIVCEDIIKKFDTLPRTGVTKPITTEIDSMLSKKSLSELITLQKQIETKLREGGTNVDGDYWDLTLKSLFIWKSKTSLKEQFKKMVKNRLEHLKMLQIKIKNSQSLPKLMPIVGANTSLAYQTYMEPKITEEISPEDTNLTVLTEMEDKFRLVASRHKIKTKLLGEGEVEGIEIETQIPVGSIGQTPLEEAFMKDASKNMDPDEEIFNEETDLSETIYEWGLSHKPRKPEYFNRMRTGFEWNKYNQTHYDAENLPPKSIKGYKFNIFYPDLVDKTKPPTYRVVEDKTSKDHMVVIFSAGPPYQDIGFRIDSQPWDYSHKKGFKSSFDPKGLLQLWFNFKRTHRARRR